MYHALGAVPPDVLAQPIAGLRAPAQFTPQTAYIHPTIDGKRVGYFDWLGAAAHVADRRSSAMHGKLFLFDTAYAGIDEENLYCRLDFMEPAGEWGKLETVLVMTIETRSREGAGSTRAYRLEAKIAAGEVQGWSFSENGQGAQPHPEISTRVRMQSIFEMQVPLRLLNAVMGSVLRIRFSLWRDRLPLDALPQEGWMEVPVLPESELAALPYAKP